MSLESLPSSTATTVGPLMTMRIIVFSLAMGVTTFAGFAVSQNINKAHTIAGKFDAAGMVFLAMGLAALPLGMILPPIIFAAGRRAPAIPGTSPEQARILGIQQRIQTSAIIGCAIFEGAAFANILAYMQTREVVHLALAGVLLVGILAHFPTTGSYQRRIDEELTRMDEEDGIRRQP